MQPLTLPQLAAVTELVRSLEDFTTSTGVEVVGVIRNSDVRVTVEPQPEGHGYLVTDVQPV